MTEAINTKLSDSKALRWGVLGLVAFTMFCGYFLTDLMSPLKTMLEKELLWDSLEYGVFTSAYGWFNVFFLMLIFGGIILDKLGVRLTGMGACILMIIGCLLKYYAISTTFPEGETLLGIKTQVALAAIGYAIFGVGIEIVGITVSKIIVKWFTGHELALAMGLEMSVARLGTLFALGVTAPLASYFEDIAAPIFIALIMLCIGALAFFMYMFYDRKFDKQIEDSNQNVGEDTFQLKDLIFIISNKGFWLLALLCVLFYSAIFPFLKFAPQFVEQKYGVVSKLAGMIPALLPLGSIILTPLFGTYYDRKGRGANLMIIGALLLILVHVSFALPFLNEWWFAAILTIILGIAFSLVPSAMWPSVPKIIPPSRLGSAYALIFWVQNWGLMGVPLLIGWVLNTYCKGPVVDGITTYDYTLPMIIFSAFGVLALFVAILLKREDKKKGYGLQDANIKS